MADVVQRFGPSALLAKMDIKVAYCLILFHPDDWLLLELCWEGCYYTDGDAAVWPQVGTQNLHSGHGRPKVVYRQWDVPFVDHYLDNFATTL